MNHEKLNKDFKTATKVVLLMALGLALVQLLIFLKLI